MGLCVCVPQSAQSHETQFLSLSLFRPAREIQTEEIYVPSIQSAKCRRCGQASYTRAQNPITQQQQQ